MASNITLILLSVAKTREPKLIESKVPREIPPCIKDETNLVEGLHRLEAAKALGAARQPCRARRQSSQERA